MTASGVSAVNEVYKVRGLEVSQLCIKKQLKCNPLLEIIFMG